MKTNYVLIDFENVQPKNLEILNGYSLKGEYRFKVIVFIGANQKKVSVEHAASLQPLGDNARYINIAGNGPNALDFHIAYYVGELAAQNPNAVFHIISKDKGFDPLIRHLKGRKINISRKVDLSKIPLLKSAKPKPEIAETKVLEERIGVVVKNLAARGKARPSKVSTLENTINTLFPTKLTKAELTRLVDELCLLKIVAIDGNKISYGPPISSS